VLGSLVFFLCSAAITGLAALARHLTTREALTRSGLKRQPATRIDRVRDGDHVKIVGRAGHAGPPLLAPLTGRACAGYQVLVEEWTPVGWREVAREERLADFLVLDGSGSAIVKTSGAEVALTYDELGLGARETDRARAFLDARGVSLRTTDDAARPLRFREALLGDGMQVAASGVGRWEDDPDPVRFSYRDVPRRLVLRAPQGARVLIADVIDVAGEPATAPSTAPATGG
jgi:hypothetical protein